MKNRTSHFCNFCGDPAKIINTIKKPFWPFEIERIDEYCYECYQEIKKGQIPKVTDPSFSSRRGRGIKKRQRLMDD